MSTHSIEALSAESNLEKIKKEPLYIFQTPEAEKWDSNTLRFIRTALVNNLPLDAGRIYRDEQFRAKFRRRCVTGVHEAGHMLGAKQKGDLGGVEVNDDGSGITWFKLRSANFHQLVSEINYIGYMGKSAEEAIGETPHGHGFDMAQNDSYAEAYSKRTGESGSAIQSQASRQASNEARSNVHFLIDTGVRLAVAA